MNSHLPISIAINPLPKLGVTRAGMRETIARLNTAVCDLIHAAPSDRRMSAYGPPRHLMRRSDLVAFGGEADVRTSTRNDAVNPKRHFASAIAALRKVHSPLMAPDASIACWRGRSTAGPFHQRSQAHCVSSGQVWT